MFCPPTLNHITNFADNQVSNIVASAQQLISDNLYLLTKMTAAWNQHSSAVLHFSYYITIYRHKHAWFKKHVKRVTNMLEFVRCCKI